MSTAIYTDQPVRLDLPKIVQGEDWQWSFALQNPDATPVDLTGVTFACKMRDGSAAARSVVFTPVITVVSNTVTLALSSATTALVTQSTRLIYDIFQTDSAERKTCLFQGAVAFDAAVTR